MTMITSVTVGKRERDKGKRGQREAANLLTDRDWVLVETNSGHSVCDLVATDESGKTWAVEVKSTKIIDLPRFKTQASDNASKLRLPWMLMCRVDGYKKWLVFRQGEELTMWGGV